MQDKKMTARYGLRYHQMEQEGLYPTAHKRVMQLGYALVQVGEESSSTCFSLSFLAKSASASRISDSKSTSGSS